MAGDLDGGWDADAPGVVTLPDGRMVRGRGLSRGWDGASPQLGACLTASQPAEQGWESLWIPWPDFRLPRDRALTMRILARLHVAAATRRVEVACDGGVGRTGTALTILARMSGVPADEAVRWVRERYHPRAVETPWQRRFAVTVDLDVEGR